MSPHVIIVAADKGGVGKTFLSRALLCYLRRFEALERRAFDTQVPSGILKRFHPGETEVVDLASSDGQMRVFDSLKPNQISVIDCQAGSATPTLRTLGDIGFLDGIKSGKRKITLMHVLGATHPSFQDIKALGALTEGARHILVTNHINEAAYRGLSADLRGAGAAVINIQKLNEHAAELVDAAGVPFADFGNVCASEVMTGYVASWLRKACAEFDAVRLVEG